MRNGHIQHRLYRRVTPSYSLNYICTLLNLLPSLGRHDHRHAGPPTLHLQHTFPSPRRAFGRLRISRRFLPTQRHCTLLTQTSDQPCFVLDRCEYFVGTNLRMDGCRDQESPSDLGFEVGNFRYSHMVFSNCLHSSPQHWNRGSLWLCLHCAVSILQYSSIRLQITN